MNKDIKQIIANAIENNTPVKCRDGKKAYLKYDIRNEDDKIKRQLEICYPIVGHRVINDILHSISWTETGEYSKDRAGLDIIGEWVEPRPTRIINGIEVPAPLSLGEFKPNKYGGMKVHCIDILGHISTYFVGARQSYGFLAGHFYANAEDAEANLDAIMKGLE